MRVTFKKLFALLVLASAIHFSPTAAHGQAISQNGGSIEGTITDPSGAAIPGATVVIASPDTGYTHTLQTGKTGFYSLGPLVPGTYTVTVSAPSFSGLADTKVVHTGTATSGDEKLTVGSKDQIITVTAGSLQVNTDQVGVAGIVTREQIEDLPINGRNILDVAQIQPGVILQSGQTFDPTKSGYSAISVNGVNGRTTRILVDGQDISDETVGTTLFNVPSGAVDEFQLNRSTQDVSGSVTSTGQVLISTQSGTNKFHGNGFYNFQDYRAGFADVNAAPAPFQRNQFGGYVGGPIFKDKLFFFGGIERIKQDDSSPANSNSHFQDIINRYPTVPDPFRDTFSILRLDYTAPHGIHLFARATYSVNAADGSAGFTPYSIFKNQDNVPALVGGADFTTGKFTHSVRYGYEKFVNAIADATVGFGNSIYNPSLITGYSIELVGGIDAGQNELAPQKTFQSDKQFRYDGTWTKGAHTLKYGGELNRINEGGYAPFFGGSLYTDVSTSSRFVLANCGNVEGAAPCTEDPLNGYKPAEYLIGNGNGVFSERPAFGLPGGGQFSWRIGAYVADTWKVTQSFTLQAGIRWSVDTDRANQDVPTPLCSQVDPSLQFAGCTGNTPLFDQFGPGEGLGQSTRQPWKNFGPQAGFVFSPGSHRLSLRAGSGIYFEDNLFNNGSNARTPIITAQGEYFNYGVAVYNSPNIVLPGYGSISALASDGSTCTTPGVGDCTSVTNLFQESVLQASAVINNLKTKYDAASKIPEPNSSFIGTGGGLNAANIYGGPYKSPYSIQVNAGVEYQLSKGLIASVDFIHSATLKVPQTVDTNHLGAARFLNKTAALNAITAVAGGTDSASIDAAIRNGATIDDFAGAGLDSAADYLGGYPASYALGTTPDMGAAFPGANANVGAGKFILPVGKAGYDALQIVLQEEKAHPLPGIVKSTAQISYNFSRAITTSKGGSNQFFAGSGPWNQDHVTEFMGRSDLDHTNQLSIATSLGIKYGLQVGVVGHFFSAPPSSLNLPGDTTGAGQIFKTDVDGDGTESDLIPTTNPGDYEHRIKNGGLLQLINQYNSTQAGTLTPAGQALVDAGLFTQPELIALGAVKPALLQAPSNPLKNAATRGFDASVSYPISFNKFHEGLSIIPGVTMYNVANMTNYNGFGGELAPATDAGPASDGLLNGRNSIDTLNPNRITRSSGAGTFDQGGPRTTEFQLKVTF